MGQGTQEADELKRYECLKKLLQYIIAIFDFCIGLGFIVSKIEKARGKKGWVDGHRAGFYERNVKRTLDFGLSLFTLIALWPVMVVTGLLVKVKLDSPVLFKQERPGLGGRIFTIRKFRTMRDGEGSDEDRLTNFGRKLRSTSLDELVELTNILDGSMSIIGPRPLLVEYLERYSERQKHRHDVRPGLTGLAQVSGRNELSWNERFDEDLEYVNNITFLGDVKILFKTVMVVLKRDGISSKTSETMEAFMGDQD